MTIDASESIIAELSLPSTWAKDSNRLDMEVRRALKAEGYTVVRVLRHNFKPYGSTTVYIIGQSHLAIHTYPEHSRVSLDITVCQRDPLPLYHHLVKAFHATGQEYYQFVRPISTDSTSIVPKGGPYRYRVADGITTFYDAEKVLFGGRTTFQRVDIIYNPRIGRALFLDGLLQFCEADVDSYGKNMTDHIMKRGCDNILVLGGGDGQVARYLLDHSPARVVIAEIDSQAVKIYEHYFPGVSKTLKDNRVKLVIADACEFVKKKAGSGETFDAVVLDLTYGPIGMNEDEYYQDFLVAVTRITPLITFFVEGPREPRKLISQAVPLAESRLASRFRELGFRPVFHTAVHPVWGSIQFFGYAERMNHRARVNSEPSQRIVGTHI